jgi:hypothetical protein
MTSSNNEAYGQIAEAMLKKMMEARGHSFIAQIDYGKWLISSLFLMHGSAIAGLAFKASGPTAPPYLFAVSWFVAGIVLALGAGFAAWWNFSFATRQYDDWANPNMLINPANWPSTPTVRGVEATKWISIACGLLSVACLVAGAVHIIRVWQ